MALSRARKSRRPNPSSISQRRVILKPVMLHMHEGFVGAFRNLEQMTRGEPIYFTMDQTPKSRQAYGDGAFTGTRPILWDNAAAGHVVVHRTMDAAKRALERTTPRDYAMMALQNV